MKTAGGAAQVVYSGSFWVEADSLDLMRLDVHAGDIPPQLGLAAVNVIIDYGAMRAGDRHVALAQASMLEMVKTSGEVNRNQIGFTQCREFVGDAKMVFGDDDPVKSAEPAAPVPTLILPGGLTISLRLSQAVETKSASVGDAVAAIVVDDVRDKQRVWLPKGATVRGRIRRLERREVGTPYVLMGLEFSEVEAWGWSVSPSDGRDAVGSDVGRGGDELSGPAGGEADGFARRTGHRQHYTVTTFAAERFDQELPGVGYLYLTTMPFVVRP